MYIWSFLTIDVETWSEPSVESGPVNRRLSPAVPMICRHMGEKQENHMDGLGAQMISGVEKGQADTHR